MGRKLENAYQAGLITRLRARFPGCFILKNDEGYLQGIPDLTILWYDRWAVLEVKKSDRESYEPNQEWYIGHLDSMSFSAMICPQNEEEILSALEQAFRARRKTRIPLSQ